MFNCKVLDSNEIINLYKDDMLYKKQLGNLQRVKVESELTTLVAEKPNKFLIDVRIKSLRKELERYKFTNFQNVINVLNERISLMNNKVRIIKIGGYSPVETREVFDRAIDAVSSAKAAIEHGVLPGGGVSLLYACLEAEKQFKVMDKQLATNSESQNNQIFDKNTKNNLKNKKKSSKKSLIEDFNLDGETYTLLGDINKSLDTDDDESLSNQIIYGSELSQNSFEEED